MLLEALIGDLLLRHNCVVVPAFGGFVAKQTEASIDYVNGTLLPPRKSLLFNRQLINNDGLIIAAFAQENAISYNEAHTELAAVIAQWHRKLNQGERVTLDKVGHLFLDQEKNIGFEQDRHFNLLLEAYGLGKVHFISEEDIQLVTAVDVKISPIETPFEAPILDMKPIGEPILKIEETSKIQSIEQKPNTIRLWRYAAAVALIPIAFYSFWIPVKTDVLESGVISSADFNPFHKTSSGKYQTKNWSFTYENPNIEFESLEDMANSISTDVRVLSYPFDENVFIAVRLSGQKTEVQSLELVEPKQTITQTVQHKTPTSPGNYRFVVGFFSTVKNASDLAEVLSKKGLNSEVLPHNGGFRVSAARSTEMDFSKIEPILSELKLTGWVLKSN